MFKKPIWANKPCFFIVKGSNKSIGRIGATTDFESVMKKLNDYINTPPEQRMRSLPTRRWDAIMAITGFRSLNDAKRFEIYVENTFRTELPLEEISYYRQFKSEEFPPCVFKRIVIARKLFREYFTEKLPREQPKIWKSWDIYWSTKLDKTLLDNLKVGWDIEDLKKMNGVSQKNDEIKEGPKKKLYVIRHKPFEFDDFIPWKELLGEWRTLKKEKQKSQPENVSEVKAVVAHEVRRPSIPLVPKVKDHWFKIVDDDDEE
ncbi:6953_t:CDS:2 [Acaulospora morrowiae]|uniref:6953_t:CDS:1 n=1 Tax=Acaulospora morrowiae TaxID=94023 RepID=A0A9N9GL75_9GLOM|nr:6953_t:CDS:2 [Acaulospora morrowiae]